jgi:hypothetical protein
MKKIIKNLLSLILLALLWSCQSETTIIEPPTELQVTVRDDANNTISNATVALFDNYATFITQNKTFGTAGAKVATSDENGLVIFDSLNPDSKYYIMAFTIDSTKFRSYGYDIYNDNSFTGFEFIRPLNKSSITRATVRLRPAEAIVSFYANNSNSDALPIKVYIETDSIATLTEIKDSSQIDINPANLPFNNGFVTRKIRLGVEPTPLRFVNAIECNNIQKLNLVAGEFNKVNVNQCNAGVVAFYTGTNNKANLPISVVINNAIKVGSINNTFATEPTNFRTANTLNYVLEPGTYSYVAKSADCIWTGDFTISVNQYTPVKLERCN